MRELCINEAHLLIRGVRCRIELHLLRLFDGVTVYLGELIVRGLEEILDILTEIRVKCTFAAVSMGLMLQCAYAAALKLIAPSIDRSWWDMPLSKQFRCLPACCG